MDPFTIIIGKNVLISKFHVKSLFKKAFQLLFFTKSTHTFEFLTVAHPVAKRAHRSKVRCIEKTYGSLSEFFLNNTNLTFLAFLYKIYITGFQNQQKNYPNSTIRIPTALPTQPICHSMPVSNFQTLIKSCSIEPEMIQVQFKDNLFSKCLCG